MRMKSEELQKLMGSKTPLEPKQEEYLQMLVADKGVEWVEQNKGFLAAEWEYVRTLL